MIALSVSETVAPSPRLQAAPADAATVSWQHGGYCSAGNREHKYGGSVEYGTRCLDAKFHTVRFQCLFRFMTKEGTLEGRHWRGRRGGGLQYPELQEEEAGVSTLDAHGERVGSPLAVVLGSVDAQPLLRCVFKFFCEKGKGEQRLKERLKEREREKTRAVVSLGGNKPS